MDFIIPSREGWGVEILLVVWCYGNRISSGCSPTQTFCTPALLTCDVLLMQIHGTQHSGSCPAVGSAGSTGYAHETQSGTANPGPQYHWRVRRDSQRVYHHVQVRILSTIVWQCTSANVSFPFLFLVDCRGDPLLTIPLPSELITLLSFMSFLISVSVPWKYASDSISFFSLRSPAHPSVGQHHLVCVWLSKDVCLFHWQQNFNLNYLYFFRHFDKDKTGYLDHQEFKSCLRSLGYDLSIVEEGEEDPEFQAILRTVDPNG